jgi:hypothetical protein
LAIAIGILIFVVGMFGGVGMDGELGYSLRRYWWVIALLGAPVLFIAMGVDVGTMIIYLVIFTVAGGLFFWWMENDFEMPKSDPIKDAFKWLRENFRW